MHNTSELVDSWELHACYTFVPNSTVERGERRGNLSRGQASKGPVRKCLRLIMFFGYLGA